MIDLPPEQFEQVRAILARLVPHREVRAFGSRVRGVARPYSDLDLAVYGPERMTLEEWGRLQEAFETSELPFRVDVVDAAAANPGFRQAIESDSVVVQTGGDTERS